MKSTGWQGGKTSERIPVIKSYTGWPQRLLAILKSLEFYLLNFCEEFLYSSALSNIFLLFRNI